MSSRRRRYHWRKSQRYVKEIVVSGFTYTHVRAAGIPTIIKPFFGDQFFWADRVEALGIGSAVRKLTVQSLTEALVSATTDVKQIERAKMVGEQIRAVSNCDVYRPACILSLFTGGWRRHGN